MHRPGWTACASPWGRAASPRLCAPTPIPCGAARTGTPELVTLLWVLMPFVADSPPVGGAVPQDSRREIRNGCGSADSISILITRLLARPPTRAPRAASTCEGERPDGCP